MCALTRPRKNLTLGGAKMIVIENPGSLGMIFAMPGDKTKNESIMNIRPTATDQDLYDIGLAIANLLNDTLSDIRLVSTKAYSA